MNPITITDPNWQWLKVAIDGDDIVVSDTMATAFGGDSDSSDDGSTACGFSTRGHPGLIGCALPMRHDDIHDRRHGFVLRNSPIPNMPFGLDAYGRDNPAGAHIDLIFLGNVVLENMPVIDLGPANWTKHGIDLTIASARKIIPNATSNNFEKRVSYRIRGAARFLQVGAPA